MRKDNRQEATGNSKKAGSVGLVSFALCALLIVLCSSASAQQPKKIHRIGYLASDDPAAGSARAEGIRLALRERGYIEGQNIAIEYRYAEGKADRYPALAAELVGLRVNIILVAGGAGTVRAAKNATKTIPIVMAGAGADPVKAGLVESLARPGGNVTGITLLARNLGGKQLELLKEAVPKVTRVAVLYDPSIVSTVLDVKEVLPVAARAMKLTIQPWEIRTEGDFDRVFAAMGKQRPDGLYVPAAGPLITANGKRTADLALKSRLPSMYQRSEAVEAGGLMSYGADQAESYRRVAYFVDRILKGAKPADLPVEQPTKFELVINLKTAKQIGITIPQSLLYRADKVIK
ncbi:MAG TPA: ABC transporter substrate-binding protein [Candidatus Binatia bacterium]|nr:ABC transporter substrate-binding protein [Candidatus Binatia bacterium]